MKKLLLILGLTLLTINNLTAQISRSDSAPMVVEGRTWWYRASIACLAAQEYGFRIAAPVELVGEKWYPVQQINHALAYIDNSLDHLNDELDWTVDTEPQTICHIRQEGNQIYTRLSSRFISKDFPLHLQYVGPCQHLFRYSDDSESLSEEVFAIISFKLYDDIDNEFVYTSDGDYEYKNFVKFKIKEVNEVSNSGVTYQQYTLAKTDECFYSVPADDIVFSIPEFGYMMSGKGLSELFFAPLGNYCSPTTPWQTDPVLRYVTDEDNNILFEAMGGFKLWEFDPAGVADVNADLENAPAAWYTIDGRMIDTPTAPGLYIRRSGNKTEKVAVRL